MRRAVLNYGALVAIAALAAGNARAQHGFFTHADTTFLTRDSGDGYHAVFRAQPGDPVWLGRVASDPGDMRQHKHVRAQIKALDELRIVPAPGAGTETLNRVGVKRLHGGWFLYAPSDWMHHRQMQHIGGWFITNETDGAVAHAVVERLQPAAGEYLRFRCVSLVSHAMDPRADAIEVRVWRVEEASGIELWEFRDAYGDVRHEWMVGLEGAQALPIIVNHSPARKAREFAFEEAGPQDVPR